MIRLRHPMCLVLIVLTLYSSTVAESTADETEAVASRVQAYVAALNRRDMDACAEHWSKNAEDMLPESGARVQGRKAIREALQKLLGTEETPKSNRARWSITRTAHARTGCW